MVGNTNFDLAGRLRSSWQIAKLHEVILRLLSLL
jgi:hypothetical protein